VGCGGRGRGSLHLTPLCSSYPPQTGPPPAVGARCAGVQSWQMPSTKPGRVKGAGASPSPIIVLRCARGRSPVQDCSGCSESRPVVAPRTFPMRERPPQGSRSDWENHVLGPEIFVEFPLRSVRCAPAVAPWLGGDANTQESSGRRRQRGGLDHSSGPRRYCLAGATDRCEEAPRRRRERSRPLFPRPRLDGPSCTPSWAPGLESFRASGLPPARSFRERRWRRLRTQPPWPYAEALEGPSAPMGPRRSLGASLEPL
jgi:hypothetical protein